MKRIIAIDASEAKSITRQAIGKILDKEAETLDESRDLSLDVIQKAFDLVRKEAATGSTFCYLKLSEEEYLHTCSAYIMAMMSEFGYQAEVGAGFVKVSWA